MENKKRLIDADALKEYLNTVEASGGHKYYRKGMDDTLHYHMPNIIDDAPTVDAVEVVRCKDCVNCVNPYGMKDDYRCTVFRGCYGHPYPIRLDDFCSYGERREGE